MVEKHIPQKSKSMGEKFVSGLEKLNWITLGISGLFILFGASIGYVMATIDAAQIAATKYIKGRIKKRRS